MKLNTLTLAVLLATSATVAQADILIDNFNAPNVAPFQTVAVDVVGATATSSYTGAGILGGTRDMSITCDSGCEDELFGAKMSVGAGVLSWSNDDNVASTASVSWDANGAGLNTNLLSLGSNLVASILKADLGFNYTIQLFSSDDNYTSLFSGTVNAVSTPEEAAYSLNWFTYGNGDYFEAGLPFSILQTGSGVDLTSVNKMVFTLSNDGQCYVSGTPCETSVDLRIDQINAVPEPSTLALLGLGLLGLGLTARRKLAA